MVNIIYIHYLGQEWDKYQRRENSVTYWPAGIHIEHLSHDRLTLGWPDGGVQNVKAILGGCYTGTQWLHRHVVLSTKVKFPGDDVSRSSKTSWKRAADKVSYFTKEDTAQAELR